MHTITPSRLIAALVLAALLPGPALGRQEAALPAADAPDAATAQPERIQGQALASGHMTVPVSIGPRGPYRFIVDTGSQRSIMAGSLAQELAIPVHHRGRILSFAGRSEVDIVHIPELRLGKRTYGDVAMALLDEAHIGAQGIIGTDSLQDQRLLIDFTRNRIEVGDSRALGGNSGYDITVTARRRAGQLILTNGMIDGIRTAIIIDTGSDTSIGNRALQKAMQHRGFQGQVRLMSITGATIIADIGLPRRLMIDDMGITNLFVAYSDSPVFPALGLEGKPALMLGMRELRLFRRVAIDFRTRRVYFDLPKLP